MTVINLVTHSEVEIAATAADVWPHILEPNAWKQGLKPVRVSGETDTVGEVRRASVEHEGVTYSLTTETVVLEDASRKVIKITTGSELDPCWASWQVQEKDGLTSVSYDVYGEIEVGDGDAEEYLTSNQQRFEAELIGLKQLVEA